METVIEDRRTTAERPAAGTDWVAPWFAASGLLAGLLASSCCLLPVTLVSLGLGGAWLGLLAPLAPYQPVFLVIAAASLVLGFRLARRPAPCAASGACAVDRRRRVVRGLLWLGAVVFAATLAFEPLILPLLFG